jgi:hypothetical protein
VNRADKRFSQAELCDLVGLDQVTANNWVLRTVLRPEMIGGRKMSRVRLFRETEVFRAKIILELVMQLGIPPSLAGNITQEQTDEWLSAVRNVRDEIYILLAGLSKVDTFKVSIARASNGRWTLRPAKKLPVTPFVTVPISRLVLDLSARIAALAGASVLPS